MKMSVKDIVRLKSFFGTTQKDKDTEDNKNYWKLIGVKGEVIDVKIDLHPAYPNKGLQVLVKFFIDVADYNLICHNKEKNSLWIFETDLDLIK